MTFSFWSRRQVAQRGVDRRRLPRWRSFGFVGAGVCGMGSFFGGGGLGFGGRGGGGGGRVGGLGGAGGFGGGGGGGWRAVRAGVLSSKPQVRGSGPLCGTPGGVARAAKRSGVPSVGRTSGAGGPTGTACVTRTHDEQAQRGAMQAASRTAILASHARSAGSGRAAAGFSRAWQAS